MSGWRRGNEREAGSSCVAEQNQRREKCALVHTNPPQHTHTVGGGVCIYTWRHSESQCTHACVRTRAHTVQSMSVSGGEHPQCICCVNMLLREFPFAFSTLTLFLCFKIVHQVCSCTESYTTIEACQDTPRGLAEGRGNEAQKFHTQFRGVGARLQVS